MLGISTLVHWTAKVRGTRQEYSLAKPGKVDATHLALTLSCFGPFLSLSAKVHDRRILQVSPAVSLSPISGLQSTKPDIDLCLLAPNSSVPLRVEFSNEKSGQLYLILYWIMFTWFVG
ncbi:hypothetical protein VTK73DRAFT_9448 [Phialemonium thermophilum]|uniref:Uncharacterized protein n=1 Tax=Phialemonium thermophilum TaxID=223376 RepID=A0ABR3XL88_9PEZI